MALVPPVLWAQRKNIVYLKIDLPEIKDPKVDLTENTFEFSGTSNGEKYSVKIEFYKEVEKDSAKWHFLGKQASFVFHKQESGPFWPRLLKDSGRHTWLKADWDKWVDESDDDDGPAGDMFGDYDSMPDFSQYSGAGAGAGSDDDDDGDDGDSDMPSLEKPE